MELRNVHITRGLYGDDTGKLKGSVEVTTISGEIKLRLSQDTCEKMLQLVADQLIENAKDVAHNITKEIIEHQVSLEAPKGE